MTMPNALGVIDLGYALGDAAQRRRAERMRPLLRDAASRAEVALLLARPRPGARECEALVSAAIAELDRFGVERVMLEIDEHDALAHAALTSHPGRFFAAAAGDPHAGMHELRRLEQLARRYALRAVTLFPCGLFPQLPIDDARCYPLFAKCVELDLALCASLGVPDERVPFAPQHVKRIDEVACCFPELRIALFDGCAPWESLAALLVRRHPNLFFVSNRSAPGTWHEAIAALASEAPDKLLFASGPGPHGLERAMKQLPELDLDASRWPLFLRDNALAVFRLPGAPAGE